MSSVHISQSAAATRDAAEQYLFEKARKHKDTQERTRLSLEKVSLCNHLVSRFDSSCMRGYRVENDESTISTRKENGLHQEEKKRSRKQK